MLKDKDIRKALITKIEKENGGHSFRIINELGICDGISRVDIAVVNGRLCGYEIKSDKDTLDRLPGQIEAYNKTFDKITVVVGKKFEGKILDIVPEYWGVELACVGKDNQVYFKKVRTSKINRNIESKSLLELLWKEELKNLLEGSGFDRVSNKNRRKLRDMAETIPLKKIKNYTREILKAREGWRVDI